MTSRTGTIRDHATPANAFPDLPFGEQILVWAVRLWVRGLKQEADHSQLLRRGFSLAGVPEAHRALEELMAVIAASATTSIDVRCPNCPEISLDEHRFLAVVGACQQDQRGTEADSLLAAWMPLPARRSALAPAWIVAQALRRGNLDVRARPWLHDLAPRSSSSNWHQAQTGMLH